MGNLKFVQKKFYIRVKITAIAQLVYSFETKEIWTQALIFSWYLKVFKYDFCLWKTVWK